MDTVGRCILLVFTIILSAFFEMSQSSLQNCNRIRIKQYSDDNMKRAKEAQKLIEKYDTVSISLIVGKTLSMIFSLIVAFFIYRHSHSEGTAILLSFITVLPMIFIFSSSLFYSIAKAESDFLIMNFAFAIKGFYIILYPFTIIVYGISEVLFKIFFSNKNKSQYTEDELNDIIEKVEEEGVIEEEESDIIQSAIEFGDTKASDIMCPIENVFSVSLKRDRKKLIRDLSEVGYSRVPVYKDDPETFIGILRASDYLVKVMTNENCDIKPFIVSPLFISPDARLTTVLNEMRRRKLHMAIIRDKERKVLGIVTMEDLLEEIVGEIYDEDDKEDGRK